MRNGETDDGEISFAGAPYLQNQRRPHHSIFEGDIAAGANMSCEPHAVWGGFTPLLYVPHIGWELEQKNKIKWRRRYMGPCY
jgi:hypothetical protein